MSRLNGWQRLWIILCVLYLCLVAALIVVLWPSPENIYHRQEFYDNLSQNSRVLIIQDENKLIESQPQIRGNSIGFIPDSAYGIGIRVNMPNNHEIVFSSKATKEEAQNIAQEYWRLVEKKSSDDKKSILLYTSLLWVIPCLLLYIFGYLVGWVIDGFRKK